MKNILISIPFNQIKDLPDKETPFIRPWLDRLNITYDETHIFVNPTSLDEQLLRISGFTLHLCKEEKVSFEEYTELINQKKIVMSTFWDHDLLLHIVPTILSGINFSEVFSKIKDVQDPISKIYAFETSFLIAYDLLTSPNKNIEQSIEELLIFVIGKIRKYHRKNNLPVMDDDFTEIQTFLNYALEQIKAQGY